MTEPLPHLLVNQRATAEKFKGKQTPRDTPTLNLNRIRSNHGSMLMGQLTQLSSGQDAILKEQRSANLGQYGVVIEFELELTELTPIESLEDKRSGIRLLAASIANGKIFAKVFVPESKLTIFEKKILDYLDPHKDSVTNHPRNQQLVEHINSIRFATFDSLWTDEAPVPIDDEARWWETWLWHDPEQPGTVATFASQAAYCQIEVSKWRVCFPERIVTTVYAKRSDFTTSIHLLNCIAEIRLHRIPSGFARTQPNVWQQKWANDIQKRVIAPEYDSPAVCILDSGINHEHILLTSCLSVENLGSVTDCGTTHDSQGHGTAMAGLAIYGDLAEHLSSDESIELSHHLESVKIIRHNGDNQDRNHGAVIEAAAKEAEKFGEDKFRIYCLALSNASQTGTSGIPTAVSAVLDKIAFGGGADDDSAPRLIVVCAGNVHQDHWADYPKVNLESEIHDPGHSWNSLTIGAYTAKDQFDPLEFPGWKLLATRFDLAPGSSTSLNWMDGTPYGKWPYKPDVVFEGGNALISPENAISAEGSLALTTTHRQPHIRHFEDFSDTSAATALGSKLSAEIASQYPEFWPETVRALIVHSARWSPPMKERFLGSVDIHQAQKARVKELIRTVGYGVPKRSYAMSCLQNQPTLVFQEEINPFENIAEPHKAPDIEFGEMKLHHLPWPSEALQSLGDEIVKLKITLSYFIEPNPSRRGKARRYCYESFGLRFELSSNLEDETNFRHRINAFAKDTEDGDPLSMSDSGWALGSKGRTLGSVHSDVWQGTASTLANRGLIAVYPTMGWWRTQVKHKRWNEKARYSLIVSIETRRTDIDLYSPIKTMLEVPIKILVPVEEE